MKKVEFNLTFEVHNIIEDFVGTIISEEDNVQNFSIESVNLTRKKKAKKKVSNGVPDKSWDVV